MSILIQTLITSCLTFGTIPAPLANQVDKSVVYQITPNDLSWINAKPPKEREQTKAKLRKCARDKGINFVETMG